MKKLAIITIITGLFLATSSFALTCKCLGISGKYGCGTRAVSDPQKPFAKVSTFCKKYFQEVQGWPEPRYIGAEKGKEVKNVQPGTALCNYVGVENAFLKLQVDSGWICYQPQDKENQAKSKQ